MELTPFVEVLKQFGPYGLCIVLMGSGLVYLIRWLREDRKTTDATHAGIRNEFLGALKDQRIEHTAALKEITADFKSAVNEQGKRIDGLSERIGVIDEHVQNLRVARNER